MPMKALFCGPRDWSRRWVVRQEMHFLPVGSVVVHGGAAGADTYADFEARHMGFTVRTYFADWGSFGKAAGGIRNQRMLDTEHPHEDGSHYEVCVAFCYDPNALTKGTGDMVRRALRTRIPVRLVDPNGTAVLLQPPGIQGTEPGEAWGLFDDES